MKINDIKSILDKGEKIFFENSKEGLDSALMAISLLKGIVTKADLSGFPYTYLYNHNGDIVLIKSLFSPINGDIIIKTISHED